MVAVTTANRGGTDRPGKGYKMTIYLYDGSTLECNEIEFSSDGKSIIADEYRIISMLEVLRIVSN